MRVRLTKLSLNKNDFRTDSVEGLAPIYPPVEGFAFRVVGAPIDPEMNVRLVTTSDVKIITKTENGYLLETQNSTYKVEELDNA